LKILGKHGLSVFRGVRKWQGSVRKRTDESPVSRDRRHRRNRGSSFER
jgi:hypothetical protein